MFKKLYKKISFKNLTFFDRILISVVGIAVLLFTYIFLRQSSYQTVTLKVSQEDVYYSIYGQGIPTWFENFFYNGMTEKNGLGTIEAEVLDISSFYKRPQTLSVYLKTKLRVTYNRASDTYTYKGTPVVIGTKLKLYLNNVLVDGLVTNIEGVNDNRQRKVLTIESKVVEENPVYLETSGTKPYLADSIKVGEEIKDQQGNTVIKVLQKQVEPAKKVTTTASGSLTVQPDPLRKDVYFTLEINATVIQGRYFVFDDTPILIDQTIPLNTPTTLLYATVTKIVKAD